MKNKQKKWLIKLILGLVVVTLLITGVLLVSIAHLDPNDYKQIIANRVKRKTGRDLNIEGNIRFSYYPWLGLEVEGVA